MSETPDPYAPPPEPSRTQPTQPYGQPPAYPPQPYPQQAYGQQPYGQQPYGQQAYPQQPYPGYAAAPQPGQPAAPGPPSGLAVAALVLGILAALGFWFPFAGLVLGLVALVLGIIAWRRADKGTGGGKAMAVVGTILGALALVASIVVTLFIVWFFRATWECYDSSLTDQQRADCINRVMEHRFGMHVDVG